jgi:hypothetical protein
MRFEFLKAAKSLILSLWVVISYCSLGCYQLFAATYHPHLQSESGGDTFMRDVDNYQEYHGDSTQKTTIRGLKILRSSETNKQIQFYN